MKGRDIAIIVLVVVGVLVLLPLLGGLGMLGGWGMGPGMMGGGMMGGGPWSGGRWGMGFPLIGGIFWLLIIGGIALVVASLVRQGPAIPAASGEAPMDILKRRLAKGEITLEEYETLKKELV